jgi:hypothetical protein
MSCALSTAPANIWPQSAAFQALENRDAHV